MNKMTYFVLRKNIRDSLPEDQRLNFDTYLAGQEKSPAIALILSLFLGTLGIDRFYLGQIGLGLMKMFTLGCLGIWTIIDWFVIMSSSRLKNIEIARKLQNNNVLTAPSGLNKSNSWIWIIIIIITSLIIISSISEKNKSSSSSVLESPKKGYTLNSLELNTLKTLLEDEAVVFTKGGDSLLKRDLLSVSTLNVEIAYNNNQVAADQKYFDKKLYLTGYIADINSGIGNKPYIVFQGNNIFLSPQAHFKNGDIKKIALLKKGQKISLVCTGGGAIAGTPMFNHCEFPTDYARQKIPQLESAVFKYLSGEKTDSKIIIGLTLMTIAAARTLPENTVCLTKTNGCIKDIQKILKSSTKNIKNVTEELRSIGIDVPSLKNSI